MYPGKYANQHPERPAFIMAGSGETVTYQAFEARANQLAHYLRDALDAVLAGATPQQTETAPVGCTIKWK